jgi:hypothetical protein
MGCLPRRAAPPDYAKQIERLIAPANLATLGERSANSRAQKAVYRLAMARKEGEKPAKVLVREEGRLEG